MVRYRLEVLAQKVFITHEVSRKSLASNSNEVEFLYQL